MSDKDSKPSFIEGWTKVIQDRSNAPDAGAVLDSLPAGMRESAKTIYGAGYTGWASAIRNWADHADRLIGRLREAEIAAANALQAGLALCSEIEQLDELPIDPEIFGAAHRQLKSVATSIQVAQRAAAASGVSPNPIDDGTGPLPIYSGKEIEE